MAEHQPTYTREFKQEAVRLLHESGKKQAQLARELGISESSLWRWRTQYEEHGAQAFPGSGHPRPEEAELRHLKHELEVVQQERDILKRGMLLRSTTADEPRYTWKEGSQRAGRSSRLLSLELG
ncbi:transposase [Ktedonospora formicarum]|uniref:Transposase n=1 Tax=Ktedonospora formicarum TaxID=2778364 RepID=A0A8J3ID64_9CHLR|nr:transposase [Ktedonospora formicarum]GHO50587.1 transposase [Ktedonospora formicarum]